MHYLLPLYQRKGWFYSAILCSLTTGRKITNLGSVWLSGSKVKENSSRHMYNYSCWHSSTGIKMNLLCCIYLSPSYWFSCYGSVPWGPSEVWFHGAHHLSSVKLKRGCMHRLHSSRLGFLHAKRLISRRSEFELISWCELRLEKCYRFYSMKMKIHSSIKLGAFWSGIFGM